MPALVDEIEANDLKAATRALNEQVNPALKAMLVDSWYDTYLGVIVLVRVIDGTLKSKDRILLMSTGSTHLCEQVGVFTPKKLEVAELGPGVTGLAVGDSVSAESHIACGTCEMCLTGNMHICQNIKFFSIDVDGERVEPSPATELPLAQLYSLF